MSFFEELKRRNVIKVGIAYSVGAWLLLQLTDVLIDTPGSYLTRWSLTLDPRWDFFRNDERFNELIRPLNIEDTAETGR